MLRKFLKISILLVFILTLSYATTLYLHGDFPMETSNTEDYDEQLKDYCLQVLAKEVSSDYSDEMLKVQAILVRTTIYKEIEEKGTDVLHTKDEIKDFLWYQRLKRAWEETEGQVVMYENKLALVPFHQISSGKTRNGKDVLGSEEYPYLQSIECQMDISAPKQIENILIPVQEIEIKEWDSAGYVIKILADGEEMSGEAFREMYGLASSCFDFQNFENDTRIITKGIGHGLGLSQYTANQMTINGKTCHEILQFFFPGTEIKEVAEILWKVE